MQFEIGVQNPTQTILTLLIGAVLALGLGWLRGRQAGIAQRKLLLATVLAPLMAAFFSHLCYCLVSLSDVLYTQSAGYWLAFWQGGQMFYGGLLGAMLALAIAGGKERIRLMDAYSSPMALMVAFARIAEGCWGQGYGEYWYEESTFFCRFPFMAYDPYYEAWAWALFMAEAAVAVAIVLVITFQKRKHDGDSVLLFFGLYAAAQVVLESLRRDEFLRWGFVRVEELLSAVVILAVLILYWVQSGKGKTVQKSLLMAVFIAMVVFCLLLEFATEGRIPFLVMLDVWHCYALMAVACAVNAACILCMRRMAIRK